MPEHSFLCKWLPRPGTYHFTLRLFKNLSCSFSTNSHLCDVTRLILLKANTFIMFSHVPMFSIICRIKIILKDIPNFLPSHLNLAPLTCLPLFTAEVLNLYAYFTSHRILTLCLWYIVLFFMAYFLLLL